MPPCAVYMPAQMDIAWHVLTETTRIVCRVMAYRNRRKPLSKTSPHRFTDRFDLVVDVVVSAEIYESSRNTSNEISRFLFTPVCSERIQISNMNNYIIRSGRFKTCSTKSVLHLIYRMERPMCELQDLRHPDMKICGIPARRHCRQCLNSAAFRRWSAIESNASRFSSSASFSKRPRCSSVSFEYGSTTNSTTRLPVD